MRPREFTFDMALSESQPPQPGEWLRGPNVVYVVTEVRPVESRIWPNRWRLRCERVGETNDLAFLAMVRASGVKVWPFEPYRKGEGPVECFGPVPVTDDGRVS